MRWAAEERRRLERLREEEADDRRRPCGVSGVSSVLTTCSNAMGSDGAWESSEAWIVEESSCMVVMGKEQIAVSETGDCGK